MVRTAGPYARGVYHYFVAFLDLMSEAYGSWNEFWATVLTSDVGEWLRTVVAAFLGGVLGGFFTLRGQARAESSQAARDRIARDNAVADAKRAETLRDARDLYEAFAHLQGEILAHPPSIGVFLGHSWSSAWKEIWSPSLRDKLRVGTFVLPDPTLRDEMLEIIWFLSRARDYTVEGQPYPGRPNHILPSLVEALAAEGVERIAGYLRGDPTFVSRRGPFWTKLRQARIEYEEWEECEVERSIARDEAAAEAEAAEAAAAAKESSADGSSAMPPSGPQH